MPEKDKHPNVHAAKRGCRSARQWQEIRQAALLARTEGVTIELHGVRVGPSVVRAEYRATSQPTLPAARDGSVAQKSETDAAERARGPQLPEAGGRERASPPSKQQPRDARRSQKRLLEFQAQKHTEKCQSRWLLITNRYRRAAVWTAWMREKATQEKLEMDAKLRVREMLWRAWKRKIALPPPAWMHEKVAQEKREMNAKLCVRELLWKAWTRKIALPPPRRKSHNLPDNSDADAEDLGAKRAEPATSPSSARAKRDKGKRRNQSRGGRSR